MTVEERFPPNTIWVTDGAVLLSPPTVTWQKGQETITKGKSYSRLFVKSTKHSDSGVYQILLQNEV